MSKVFLGATAFVLGLTAQAAAGQDGTQQILLMNESMAQLQATQQANAAMQQAMQNSQDANALAMQNALMMNVVQVPVPRISIKAGQYAGPVQVSIMDKSRKALIFYTTDGWSPTPKSQRYTGPITISASTELKAVAYLPGVGRSGAAVAEYTLPTKRPTSSKQPGSVSVVFTAPVDSRTAQVNDPVSVALAQDLQWHGQLIPAGTPVQAVITQLRRPGWSGVPGSITFTVQSVNLSGSSIALSGDATEDGPEKAHGRGHVFSRGNEAEIPKGAQLTVQLAAN